MIHLKRLILFLFIVSACQSFGFLTLETSINYRLKEVSAVALNLCSELIWDTEDDGNGNYLYAINEKGIITNWEDLTSNNYILVTLETIVES